MKENGMPTRNVVLTDSQAKFVEQMVVSGHYQSASEVLREGLRLVQAREAEQAAKLAAMVAWASPTRGRRYAERTGCFADLLV
jgi:antitoxin ParD1/3/4